MRRPGAKPARRPVARRARDGGSSSSSESEQEVSVIAGPPFSVPDDEVLSYWSDFPAVHSFEALDHSPPKFKEAGLTSVMEKIWYTPGG